MLCILLGTYSQGFYTVSQHVIFWPLCNKWLHWMYQWVNLFIIQNCNSLHISIFAHFTTPIRKLPHRRCLYLIVVVSFEGSWDPESYAGGSVATGRVTHAGQVKEPDEEGYPGSPGWGLGVRLTTSHRKNLIVQKLENQPRMDENREEWRQIVQEAKAHPEL
jgi:hypothetical protein